jgi:hypothetical protein
LVTPSFLAWLAVAGVSMLPAPTNNRARKTKAD